MSKARLLTLSDDALSIVQGALAALRGLYEAQANYGRDDDGQWMKKLCAVEEVADSIEKQTGVVLPASSVAAPAASPY